MRSIPLRIHSVLGLSLLAGAWGCADPGAPASVMVAITSEAPIPEGIDSVEVSVERAGIERFYNVYSRDNSSERLLPGTLAIDRPVDDANDSPVTIVVRARLGSEERALRRATFSFVDGEQRLLRMPIRIACMTDDLLACGSGQTCRSGICEADSVDLSEQPNYERGLVFPEDAAECYNPASCNEATRVWLPAEALLRVLGSDCTLPGAVIDGVARSDVNMEFVWRDDPRNARDSLQNTAVTLDYDAAEGWEFAAEGPSRVRLVPGVCEAVRDGRVLGTYEVFGCKPKDPFVPTCSGASLVLDR